MAVALRSCRAVTLTGRTVPPHKRTDNHHSGPLIGPVWIERTLMGQSRVVVVAREGASLHREVSVSWETTLIVYPCPESPIPPQSQPPLFIFSSPSLVVHKASSCVKRTPLTRQEKTLSDYLRVLFYWLTLTKKARSKNILT